MRLKPYPKYKASGVEWLGDVPEGWHISRLKWLVAQTSEKIQAKETDVEYVGMENIESWSGKWVESASIFEAEGLANSFDAQDVLFGKLRPYLAKAWLADRQGICSSELLVLKPKEINAGFLLHQVLNVDFINLVDSSTYGSKMPRASWDFIGAIELPLPSPTEQSNIATFLDRETAKIDTLIAKQEKLIELLKEKRQAVISHAVTKGLDPTVPMKPSGVEWLGDVPAHWGAAPLKRFIRSVPGAIKTGPFGSQLISSEMQEGEIKVYNQRSVIDADFEAGENYITQQKFSELKGFEIMAGDILVTTRGTIGRAAIFPNTAKVGILHPCLLRVQVEPTILFAEFLITVIQDSYLLQNQLKILSNSTTIEVIYSETMASVVIALPPILEQRVIVKYLYDVTTKIDTLITKAQQAIALQKEHRTALISAAVTGKIDVRSAVAERKAA